MTKEQREKLPRAGLIDFRWCQRGYFGKFRLANAMQVQVGRLTIMWRMPWLEHSARQIYPQVFS